MDCCGLFWTVVDCYGLLWTVVDGHSDQIEKNSNGKCLKTTNGKWFLYVIPFRDY